MKTIAGRVVAMHYTLTDDSGEVLDSSAGGEPLAYLHGHNNIVVGLEKALEGAEAGFKSRVIVAPAEGYGEKNLKAIFEEPRASFSPDMKLEPGMQIQGDGKHGPVAFTVIALTDTGVMLDGNHPLAGKTLHFDVEVVKVRKATADELAHGHVHTGHDHH
jgi:FKBP-type peptidyl-prolyl cis-trans isomerase SlyD